MNGVFISMGWEDWVNARLWICMGVDANDVQHEFFKLTRHMTNRILPTLMHNQGVWTSLDDVSPL